MPKINIINIKIDNVSMLEAIEKIELLIRKNEQSSVVTPNVDHIVKLQDDPEFRHIYEKASLVLVDGMPLLWAAKLLGAPFKEKVSGSDLFIKLCEVAASKGYKLFLLGGKPQSALKASEILRNKHPGLQVRGTYSPPFGFENDKSENDKIIKLIRDARPDILFVGLGAPKQEKWIYDYKDECRVPVSIGVGASFDFVAGTVKRAPEWMRGVGLEWFWRLMMEPGRLWKRYLIDDTRFFWLVFRQKMNQVKNSAAHNPKYDETN